MYFYLYTSRSNYLLFRKINVVDNMMKLLEQHARHLEEVVKQRSADLEAEEKKVEALLCSIMPR